MVPTGCFNCRNNTGEHPQYEVGKKFHFVCEAIAGHSGNSVMMPEDPTKGVCEHFKAYNKTVEFDEAKTAAIYTNNSGSGLPVGFPCPPCGTPRNSL